MEQYTTFDGVIKILIVWNNSFGVDVPLTENPGGWFPQARTENFPRGKFWVKMQFLPLLYSLLFGGFFLIFTVANKLPGFSINRLTNVEDFLNENIILNCKYKCEYEIFSSKYICVVYYLKLYFYCLTWPVTDFRDFSSSNRNAASV